MDSQEEKLPGSKIQISESKFFTPNLFEEIFWLMISLFYICKSTSELLCPDVSLAVRFPGTKCETLQNSR